MPDEQPKKRIDPLAYFRSWTRRDWVALAAFVVLILIFAVPTYSPKNGCEVARPDYKCIPAKTVMAEHCGYWGNFSCDTGSDASLPQVEWYIGNLCRIHDNLHPDDLLDCGNLMKACNQAAGEQVCPLA